MDPAQPYSLEMRPTTPDDLDFIVSLERQPDVQPFIESWTRDEHLEATRDSDKRHLTLLASDSGEQVGFVLLAGIDNPHLSIEFKRIVIGPRAKGIGRTAIRLVKKYAFGELGAHRLWLDVKDSNQQARALYASEGFIEEGTLRECIKTGEDYESLVVMSMLAGEYHMA